MTSSNPPYPYYNGIAYNSAFFSTNGGSGISLAKANALYLQKTTVDTATALETFSGGLATNSIQNIGTTDLTILNNSTAGNVKVLDGNYTGSSSGNLNIMTGTYPSFGLSGGNINIQTGTSKGSITIGNFLSSMFVNTLATFSVLPLSSGSYSGISGGDTSNTIITSNWINSTWLSFLRSLSNTWSAFQTFNGGLSSNSSTLTGTINVNTPMTIGYSPSFTSASQIGWQSSQSEQFYGQYFSDYREIGWFWVSGLPNGVYHCSGSIYMQSNSNSTLALSVIASQYTPVNQGDTINTTGGKYVIGTRNSVGDVASGYRISGSGIITLTGSYSNLILDTTYAKTGSPYGYITVSLTVTRIA